MKINKFVFENGQYNISAALQIPKNEGNVRKEFLENSLLNIYSPRMGNPVVEDLMDKVVLSRRVPLNDGVETLKAIKEKFPYLTKYVDVCLEELKRYRNMV